MYYDAPKSLPIKPHFAEIRAYQAPEPQEQGVHNECYVELTRSYDFNCLDLGGYVSRGTAGTANVTISGNYPQLNAINFMPRDGVIPEVEIQRQHIANWLELSQEKKERI